MTERKPRPLNEFDDEMPAEAWTRVHILRVPIPWADLAWFELHCPAGRPLSSVALDLLTLWATFEELGGAGAAQMFVSIFRETGNLRTCPPATGGERRSSPARPARVATCLEKPSCGPGQV
jgi:hypothetical protein